MLGSLLKSSGMKRTAASILVVASFLPPLIPYRDLLLEASGIVATAGLTHAALDLMLKRVKEIFSGREE